MDTEKSRALLKILETGSFSQAAEQLGYTPSGINRMAKTMEKETGFPLFTRSTSGVQLTSEGRRLLPVFHELVQNQERLDQLCADIRGLSSGHLSIGSYYSISASWLPQIIQRFQTNWPGIQIDLCEAGNHDLCQRLADHTIDCCFFSEYQGQCDWIPLQRDELVVWLPENHPLADAGCFPLESLNNSPFIQILPEQNTDLERLLHTYQLTPDVRFTTSDNYTAYSMVAAGLGISVNNALMTKNWQGPVVTLPLNPPQYITLGIALPSSAKASPALQKFIACTKIVIQSQSHIETV